MKTGYKGTYNYKCLDHTYEVGQEYKINEKPEMCRKGFHYCTHSYDVLCYYPHKKGFKLLEIEDLSNHTIHCWDKSCSNHIKIVREVIDPDELFTLLGVQYTYTKTGQILTFKNKYGYSFFYEYDEFDRKVIYKNSMGTVYNYSYDENGKLTIT